VLFRRVEDEFRKGSFKAVDLKLTQRPRSKNTARAPLAPKNNSDRSRSKTRTRNDKRERSQSHCRKPAASLPIPQGQCGDTPRNSQVAPEDQKENLANIQINVLGSKRQKPTPSHIFPPHSSSDHGSWLLKQGWGDL
jgi:hypothetical protein